MAQRLANQSWTEGLSLTVRYSRVPISGVGFAMVGVRMMSHSSKKAPKPRDAVLKASCIPVRSE